MESQNISTGLFSDFLDLEKINIKKNKPITTNN